jgi:membrane associated rhomboid family serine protease
MGLYDREYYRSTPGGGGLMGGFAPACRWLIAANIAIFFLQIVTLHGAGGGATEWLILEPLRILRHYEIWRLLTYAFCHDPDDILHLLFNMWMLWLCGSQVEPIYGAREFLRFYLTAAVFAGICYLGFGLIVKQPNPMLGASGAVMAVTMLCAMYYPTQKIYVFFVFPLEMRWMVAIAALFDVVPIVDELLGGGAVGTKVAHAAHLGGLLFGFLYKRYDLRIDRLISDSGLRQLVRSSTRSRAKVRLYRPPEEGGKQVDLDRRVDEILAKITAQGESSLSDAEREVLKEASRRYKGR